MKKKKLTKVIAVSLLVASMLAVYPIRTNAEWRQDSNGWWNTEEASWSVGWKQIDGKWYYFGQDGYMVHDTTIDGYNIGSDGTWIESRQNGDNSTFTIDKFVSLMKTKGYALEVKDADENFLPTTRKTITLGNEQLDVYIYNSNEEMEKDSLNIDKDGFGYTITEVWGRQIPNDAIWTSYPHFYKKGNIIVQYIGKNENIISSLKNILGEQFVGMKESSDLSSTEKDIREITFEQLDPDVQKEIKSWTNSKISIRTVGGAMLKDESYLNKETYCIEFFSNDYHSDVTIVFVGIDNHKIVAVGLLD